jgi:hypothetical protein
MPEVIPGYTHTHHGSHPGCLIPVFQSRLCKFLQQDGTMEWLTGDLERLFGHLHFMRECKSDVFGQKFPLPPKYAAVLSYVTPGLVWKR